MKPFRFLILAVLTFWSAGSIFAQDPQEPAADSARATTTDTLAADTSRVFANDAAAGQDSVRPIPQLAPIHFDPATGFTSGVWTWTRDSLMLEAPITLGDLLERLPGVMTLRSGLYVQPEAASSLGGTGNRLEVWLDGFVLDPLLESSFDVTKLELANIESVRVERRMSTIRVHVETLSARETRAYSMVEAAVGEPDANLFRGVFLAPRLFFGPLSLAIDRIDTNGLAGAEAADQFAGWAKWSYIRNGGSGVQVEFRRMSTDRDPESPYTAKYLRDDLIVRARARLLDNLVAEVFGGRTALDVDTVLAADNDSLPLVETNSMQWGARASYASPLMWARGAFRMRDHEVLPSVQIDASAGVTHRIFSAAVEMTQSSWRESESATELTLRAEAGPFRGIRLFGERTTSDRGVPFLNGAVDTLDATALLTNYEGLRAGAQVQWRGIVAGGAMLKVKSDSTTTFGLPFDQQRRLYFGSDATGWEVVGRVPIPWVTGLAATGMVTDWYSGNVSLYMPTRVWRAGAELHAIPLKSGNLEILGRVELVHRGSMLVPPLGEVVEGDPDEEDPFEDPEEPLATAPIESIDAYLQIRIMAVRAFLRWEDLGANNVAEFPGRALRGPRLFYGVKWEFTN